ncbi:MAG TPA: ABC transporter substrate-binding protein, partial [Anaerolineae bacterium]
MKTSIIGERNIQVKLVNRLYLIGLLLVLVLVISACGGAAPVPPAEEAQPAAEQVEEAAEPVEEVEETPAEEEAMEEEAPAEEEAMEEEASGEPIFFFAPAELSGAGATVGNNWKDGATIAIEEINAAGGILGRPIEVEWEDTQSDPATSKAVIAKGLEQDPYVVLGPLYSGSIIVNMVEAERAETTQIMGGEAANLTEQGNPFIFRTSF